MEVVFRDDPLNRVKNYFTFKCNRQLMMHKTVRPH